jgi:heme oxygenase
MSWPTQPTLRLSLHIHMSDTLAISGKLRSSTLIGASSLSCRFFSNLSGGQVIRRRIAKGYNLDEDTGFGVSFYNFNQLGGNKPATQGDMKKIKQWFRDGINAAPAGDDEYTGM